LLEALLEHTLAAVGGEHFVVDGEPVEGGKPAGPCAAASFLISPRKAVKPPGGLHCAASAGAAVSVNATAVAASSAFMVIGLSMVSSPPRQHRSSGLEAEALAGRYRAASAIAQ
jgi:hypothetical protein